MRYKNSKRVFIEVSGLQNNIWEFDFFFKKFLYSYERARFWDLVFWELEFRFLRPNQRVLLYEWKIFFEKNQILKSYFEVPFYFLDIRKKCFFSLTVRCHVRSHVTPVRKASFAIFAFEWLLRVLNYFLISMKRKHRKTNFNLGIKLTQGVKLLREVLSLNCSRCSCRRSAKSTCEKKLEEIYIAHIISFPKFEIIFVFYANKNLCLWNFLTHSFSPVCVLICPSSSQALEKAFPQYWHTQGRSCCLMWLFRSVSEVVW